MLVQHTAAKIAELRGISVEELIEATYQNGKRIYGIE
jgi:Tat protein secretion system quality control protein TatD with DNase activity